MSGTSQQDLAPAPKPLRADAARNRDALLAAAAQAFDERGSDAPLEDIARRAGVGIGTLYRHFPTRDAVLEAVYRREVETLCAGVAELRTNGDPVEALSSWMRAFVGYVGRKRGMAMALKATLGIDNELFTESSRRIRESLSLLVGDAVAVGRIRDDVDPLDLMRAMSGICMGADPNGNSAGTERIIGLLLDGLRYGARNA